MFAKPNPIFVWMILGLFVIGGIIFFIDGPNWVWSIPIFFTAIAVPAVYGIWQNSKWAANAFEQHFGSDLKHGKDNL